MCTYSYKYKHLYELVLYKLVQVEQACAYVPRCAAGCTSSVEYTKNKYRPPGYTKTFAVSAVRPNGGGSHRSSFNERTDALALPGAPFTGAHPLADGVSCISCMREDANRAL